MTEAILITAADGTVVTVNRAFTEITGYSRDDALGNSANAIRNGLQPPEFYEEVNAIVRAVRDGTSAVSHYVVVFYEVGESRSATGAADGQRA